MFKSIFLSCIVSTATWLKFLQPPWSLHHRNLRWKIHTSNITGNVKPTLAFLRRNLRHAHAPSTRGASQKCLQTQLGVSCQRHSWLSLWYKIHNNLVNIKADCSVHSSDARTRGQHWLFQKELKNKILGNVYFPRTMCQWTFYHPERHCTFSGCFRSLLME